MSWFGETFGEGLSNLKGQITKITKEVLADDDTVASQSGESNDPLVKELEAVCESKDLEIASLREELKKLQNQCKFDISNQHDIESHSQNQKSRDLEDEIINLKKERDHLNSCLDELQSEHQANLSQVILIKDNYKRELDDLRKEFVIVKTELSEVLRDQEINLSLNNHTKQLSNTESEIGCLNKEIIQLQSQIETEKKEKEEALDALKKEREDKHILEEKLNKLYNDLDVIKKGQKTDDSSEKNKLQISDLKERLTAKENEMNEIEIKLKILYNEKNELLKTCQKQEDIELKLSDTVNYLSEIQNKLKNVLQDCNVTVEEEKSDNEILHLLSLINSEWKSCQQGNLKFKEISNKLEIEVKILKEENESLKNELKTYIEKCTETEKNYQEEVSGLKNIISEMKSQRQNCLNESQTDDVKRLEQEVDKFMKLLFTKNNEIKDYSQSISDLEEEVRNLKISCSSTKEELCESDKNKARLENEIEHLKNQNFEFSQKLVNTEEKVKAVESDNSNLKKTNSELKSHIQELEKQLTSCIGSERTKNLQELEKIQLSKQELEKFCGQLQKLNSDLKNEIENVRAEVIIKETNLTELMKANAVFQEEVNKLQSLNNELLNSEKEMKKWKDASVDLEMQREDLLTKKEEVENECLRLKSELELLSVKDTEIIQLKQANSNLIDSCNKLHYELEAKLQSEALHIGKVNELEGKCQEQIVIISDLKEENSELKTRVHKFQEQIKTQMFNLQIPIPSESDTDAQQHRRSKSEVNIELFPTTESQKPIDSEEIKLLKQTIQQERDKYQTLQRQFQEISEKEANARKEFERLKQHLLEMEDHYTEEAVENEKVINDLKSKLIAAEEQIQNSSTLYTSMKVRDNQHLESLQSQIRLMSSQRDNFQAKLSAAEDEVQKHKASLMSLQIVLEQFQQDKEQELERLAANYEKQLQVSHSCYKDLEAETEGLKKQLSEAKNGLKAASRLGEQLEKKTQQVIELEEKLSIFKNQVSELENKLAVANQSNNGKIDKSLIKNLVIGYVLSSNAERKSQVLRIMASVLDFDEDERNKLAVDSSNSGWLSNILHPKGGSSSNSQSLSEAFIKFLENESRPQPQLKFIPEQMETNSVRSTKPSSTSPKPSGRFSELMLPTFNSSQENESSVILKSVLKDS